MQLPSCPWFKVLRTLLPVTVAAILTSLSIGGLVSPCVSQVLAAEAGAPPASSTTPAAVDDGAVALVNGYVITERQLYEALLDLAGRNVLNQLIDEVLIMQQAEAASVTVTEEEVALRLQEIRSRFSSELEFQQALEQVGLTENLFRRQLYLDALIIRLLTPRTKVTEEDVRAYFEAHKAEYDQPAQVRARHILVKTKEEAEAIRAELAKGADFAELARTRSLDKGSATSGGELGFFTADDVVPEFAAAAFSLQPGEVSEPVQTVYGFHIIQVEERKEAKPATFEEVAPLIRQALTDEQLQQLVPVWLNEIRAQADILILLP
ncbi:MAG: peptidyl-prolyl cis-trans isomerase [Limnochordales bacterium]|nr:peptidyl-prolyl cis-trans isomerase [Limnochordales bacterium]